jgi:predicted DCC family thiol-disulfide oxidoreductase YuxK
MDTKNTARGDFLLYDGECPACSAYVAMAQLRRLYPHLEILDARTEPALVADLRRQGYEINDSMVLRLDGALHVGAAATRTIARLGRASPSRWRRAGLSFIGVAPYRWLSRGRLALLRLLRRRPIN